MERIVKSSKKCDDLKIMKTRTPRHCWLYGTGPSRSLLCCHSDLFWEHHRMMIASESEFVEVTDTQLPDYPLPEQVTHTPTPSHPHTLTLPHPHTLTLSHPYILTPSYPHTLTLPHPHTFIPPHPHILTPPYPHTLTLTPSHPHPHTLLIPSHPHTPTLSSHSYTPTPTYPYLHTLTPLHPSPPNTLTFTPLHYTVTLLPTPHTLTPSHPTLSHHTVTLPPPQTPYTTQ